MVDSAAQLGKALRDGLMLELGCGGIARIYLAHDLKHDGPFALEALHPVL